MANIRKQAILSSILVYFGFFIGAINTYFFTRNGSFTPEQFALTRIFYDLGQNIFVFSTMGILPVMYKFYPYYKDNVEERRNDLLTWALVVSFIGFIMVMIAGWVFQPMFVRKFAERSPLILEYYHLIFLFGFGMLFFSVLEAYCWSLQKTVFSNFLKETGMRMVILALILLYYFKILSFPAFMVLFTFTYFIIFVAILLYLIKLGRFRLVFKPSRVTLKFKKKIFTMQSLIYGGVVIQVIAQTIDSLIIASLKGLGSTAVFSLAQYAANLIQVPQRSILSISTGVLSQAWKEKDFEQINRIYHRSSINLLLLALFIFGNIWINLREALTVLNIQEDYVAAINVIFVLGLARLVDAGTGVNGTIISTSVYWRFDFISGIVLLFLRIPLTYFLIKEYNIIGSAFAELIAYSVYNYIRFEFLRRKFGMQPFSLKTAYSLLLAATGVGLCYGLLRHWGGWTGIILRTGVFSTIMIAGIFIFSLTPDAWQIYHKWADKLRQKYHPK